MPKYFFIAEKTKIIEREPVERRSNTPNLIPQVNF
jgi:hypothetical protein